MSLSSGSEPGHCPASYDCSTQDYGNQSWSSFSVGSAPCYVGICSDLISCISSFLIILTYVVWKDIREVTSQSIVTFIAISDLITAATYMAGSVNLLVFDTSEKQLDLHDCEIFETVCTVESYVVTCSTMCSYFWTMILGIHLFLIVVCNKANLANKLLPLYHIFAWGIPILIAFPLLLFGKLMFAPFVTGVWCYIELHHDTSTYNKIEPSTLALLELPEVIAFVLMILLFTITRWYISKQIETVKTAGLLPHEQDKAKGRITKLERTLVFIPIAFVVLRMWAVVQYFYSIYLQNIEVKGHCIPTVPHKQIHVTLGILQAIGGGGQGWMNGILYILLSANIRNRFTLAIKSCFGKCTRWRIIKKWSSQQEPSSADTTHFSLSHEPIETDHLIKDWVIIK